MRKLAATTLLAIAAVVVTSGTAHGTPDFTPQGDVVRVTGPDTVSGTDHGVEFTMVKRDNGTVETTLEGGTFALTADGVSVLDTVGSVVDQVPLRAMLNDREVMVDPVIDPTGTVLTATPIGYWVQNPSPREMNTYIGIALGAFAGAALGNLAMLIITIATFGVGLLALPFVVIGATLLGGAIGGKIGESIPASDQSTGAQYYVQCFAGICH
ncbi:MULTISPECIES: hypothetical protein [unclassified Nocardia]|uniref:hypothetical protein n=1 Tax=unclassified Nocardia TaxID=2637762 RepID=UPI0024A8E25B|nr:MULTISPECIES: hypothetical protein [unclassified Nocardia]